MRDQRGEPREQDGTPEGGDRGKGSAAVAWADARHPRALGPLPLAARRALWDKIWDQLLVPPSAESGHDLNEDPSEANLADSPAGEGGAR